MPVRHALLAAFAVLVTGMAVYLFLEVRKPASAQTATVASKETKEKDQPDERDDASPDEPPAPSKRVAGAFGVPKATPTPVTETPAAPAIDTPAEGKLEGPKLDAVMAEANKAYDKQDFDEARSIAQKVLKQHPTNARMLRIMTSSHCIEADTAEAQKYFNLLPGPDREQMKTRCTRYGVTFAEPPAK